MSEHNVQHWLRNEPAFAALVEQGAPLLAVALAPFSLIYANRSALALLEATDFASLAHRLETSTEHGARRLRELGLIIPQGGQRLERLRFISRNGSDLLTMLCKRHEDETAPTLALAVLGLSESDLKRLNRAPAPAVIRAPTAQPLAEIQAPPAHQAAEPQTAHEASVQPVAPEPAARRTGLQRLTFQTDAEGKLTALSPEFASSGLRHADRALGHTLAELAGDAALAAHLASHATWHNVQVAWPLEHDETRIPVTLSAAPILNSAKQWIGYRGFGLINFDGAIAPTAPISPEPISREPAASTLQAPAPEPLASEPLASELHASASHALKSWPLEIAEQSAQPVHVPALHEASALAAPVAPQLVPEHTPPHSDVAYPIAFTRGPFEPAPHQPIPATDATELETDEERAAWQLEADPMHVEKRHVETRHVERKSAEANNAEAHHDTSSHAHTKHDAVTIAEPVHPGLTNPALTPAAPTPLAHSPAAPLEAVEPTQILPEKPVSHHSDEIPSASGKTQSAPDEIPSVPVEILSERAEHALHLTAPHSAVPQSPSPESKAQPPLTAQPEPARAESLRPNVVPLNPARPFHLPDQDGILLSNSERLAFREIARALGARVEDDKPAPQRASAPESAPLAIPDLAKAPHAAPEPTPSHARPVAELEPNHASHKPEAPTSIAMLQDKAAAKTDNINQDVSADLPQPEDLPLATSLAVPPGTDYGLAHNSAALLDRLPVGVLVSRGDVPIFANRQFLDMLGYADTDQFHAEGGVHHLFAARPDPLPNAAPDKHPMALQARNGDIIHAEAHLQSITWNGDPASLLALRRLAEPDPAPRLKALELELRSRESEARELHDILDTATDGILVLDDKGQILEVNRSAEALLGFEQTDVVGQNFTILLNPESHAAALDYLEGMKANGVASVLNDGRDVIGRERHGRAVPLFMTLGRVGSERKGRFCAVLRDVTHWKKAESELNDARKEAERSSAQKSDFLAKISHEIRTPLNAIIGFAEVIMQERFGPVGNERYKDYLKDIHASGMHVMSLVNDLLDLSKIESGKLELSFTSVNANRIIQDCVALMQPQATKERVVIRVSLAPRLPNIVCDERSLRQIVLNLLSNAVKFNDPGGQVIVSTALTDAGHAVIRVRDTGIGMNEADIERALEPFRQLETTRKANGTGLGLPLTKAMVEANRAAFSIKSKRGEGTLVEVMFPPTRVLAE